MYWTNTFFLKAPLQPPASLYNNSIKAQRNQGHFFSLPVNLQRVEHSITSLKIYGKCSSFLLSLNITAVSMNFTAVLPATVSSKPETSPSPFMLAELKTRILVLNSLFFTATYQTVAFSCCSVTATLLKS